LTSPRPPPAIVASRLPCSNDAAWRGSSATQIDVQELATVADCQDGFLLGKGMFQDGSVSGLSSQVGRRREALAYGSIFRWLYIRGATRQNEGVQGRKRPIKLDRVRQGYQDRLSPCATHGVLVVLDLGAVPLGPFLRSAPRNAYPWAKRGASRCRCGGHRTLHRSIRGGEAATQATPQRRAEVECRSTASRPNSGR